MNQKIRYRPWHLLSPAVAASAWGEWSASCPCSACSGTTPGWRGETAPSSRSAAPSWGRRDAGWRCSTCEACAAASRSGRFEPASSCARLCGLVPACSPARVLLGLRYNFTIRLYNTTLQYHFTTQLYNVTLRYSFIAKRRMCRENVMVSSALTQTFASVIKPKTLLRHYPPPPPPTHPLPPQKKKFEWKKPKW